MSENMRFMGAIAKAVSNSPELQQLKWKTVSVILELDGEGYLSGTYGYAYNISGVSTAVALDIDEVEEPVAAYREWLRRDGDKGFTKMLFQ